MDPIMPRMPCLKKQKIIRQPDWPSLLNSSPAGLMPPMIRILPSILLWLIPNHIAFYPVPIYLLSDFDLPDQVSWLESSVAYPIAVKLFLCSDHSTDACFRGCHIFYRLSRLQDKNRVFFIVLNLRYQISTLIECISWQVIKNTYAFTRITFMFAPNPTFTLSLPRFIGRSCEWCMLTILSGALCVRLPYIWSYCSNTFLIVSQYACSHFSTGSTGSTGTLITIFW